jgi:SAM-dependent methyltransferase
MKKSVCQKLITPLAIWQELLSDPTDFVELKVTGMTGSRSITGQVSLLDQAAGIYQAVLPGENISGNIVLIFKWLHERICVYDSCQLILSIRGQSQILKADQKGVSLQSGVKTAIENKKQEINHSYGTSDKRNYRIQLSEAADLLTAIGIVDPNGKLKTDKWRKYYQIDRFVELSEPILAELVTNEESLNIYDLACGKSYLPFVLNYYIRDKLNKTCRITGIDISQQVIESSQKLASRLNYRNMSFEKMDLRDFKPEGKVSLCISLHACDTATDMALAAAVRAESRAILAVPCCQRELLAGDFRMKPLQDSVMSSGILKARLADLITDGMRILLLQSAGYDANIIEYISPLETPKNLMIRAVYTGRPDKSAWLQYKELQKECRADILLGREIEMLKLHDI